MYDSCCSLCYCSTANVATNSGWQWPDQSQSWHEDRSSSASQRPEVLDAASQQGRTPAPDAQPVDSAQLGPLPAVRYQTRNWHSSQRIVLSNVLYILCQCNLLQCGHADCQCHRAIGHRLLISHWNNITVNNCCTIELAFSYCYSFMYCLNNFKPQNKVQCLGQILAKYITLTLFHLNSAYHNC